MELFGNSAEHSRTFHRLRTIEKTGANTPLRWICWLHRETRLLKRVMGMESPEQTTSIYHRKPLERQQRCSHPDAAQSCLPRCPRCGSERDTRSSTSPCCGVGRAPSIPDESIAKSTSRFAEGVVGSAWFKEGRAVTISSITSLVELISHSPTIVQCIIPFQSFLDDCRDLLRLPSMPYHSSTERETG